MDTAPRRAAAAVVNSLLRICNFYGLAPFIRHAIEHVDYIIWMWSMAGHGHKNGRPPYGRASLLSPPWSIMMAIVMLMVFWTPQECFTRFTVLYKTQRSIIWPARVSTGINCLALSVWDNCKLVSCHDYVCVSVKRGSICNFRVLRVIVRGGGDFLGLQLGGNRMDLKQKWFKGTELRTAMYQLQCKGWNSSLPCWKYFFFDFQVWFSCDFDLDRKSKTRATWMFRHHSGETSRLWKIGQRQVTFSYTSLTTRCKWAKIGHPLEIGRKSSSKQRFFLNYIDFDFSRHLLLDLN